MVVHFHCRLNIMLVVHTNKLEYNEVRSTIKSQETIFLFYKWRDEQGDCNKTIYFK